MPEDSADRVQQPAGFELPRAGLVIQAPVNGLKGCPHFSDALFITACRADPSECIGNRLGMSAAAMRVVERGV